jgi:hypothetical protein
VAHTPRITITNVFFIVVCLSLFTVVMRYFATGADVIVLLIFLMISVLYFFMRDMNPPGSEEPFLLFWSYNPIFMTLFWVLNQITHFIR